MNRFVGAGALLAALLTVGCTVDDDRAADTTAMGDTAAMGDTLAGTQPAAPLAEGADDRAETALSTDTTLRRYGLDVDEDDNRLVIKGKVRTEAERSRAEEVARGLAGGAAIENRVEVDPNAEVNDNPVDVDDLEDQIEDAFEADTMFRGLDLDVDESNGQIVLGGRASAAQRSAAEELAKRLAGTVQVMNRITTQ